MGDLIPSPTYGKNGHPIIPMITDGVLKHMLAGLEKSILDEYQERYSTRNEAPTGHKRAVTFARLGYLGKILLKIKGEF